MHKHHIVPRHMGGTDDKSNLVLLTVEEHAEAHRVLYEQHGMLEDYAAWKGLLGEIGDEERINLLRTMGGKKRANMPDNQFYDKEWQKKHNPFYDPERQEEFRKRSRTPEANSKRRATMSANEHQQGAKNSQYGTRWIHSLEEKRCRKINRDDPLPEGWIEGRKMKFVDAV